MDKPGASDDASVTRVAPNLQAAAEGSGASLLMPVLLTILGGVLVLLTFAATPARAVLPPRATRALLYRREEVVLFCTGAFLTTCIALVILQ